MSDDISLNLRRARFDRVAASAQISVRPLPFVEGIGRAVRQLTVRTQNFHGGLLKALIQFAPENFLNRAFGPGTPVSLIREKARI